MEMELDVQITKKDLYDYQLHHAYTSPSGLFGTIVGCLFVVGFINTGTPLYLVIGAFIILYFPWTLHIKAAAQAQSPVFRKPLHYRLSEEGLEISTEEEEMLAAAKRACDKVIVVLNTSNTMELGFIEDEGIDAALLVGLTGLTGVNSLVDILGGGDTFIRIR